MPAFRCFAMNQHIGAHITDIVYDDNGAIWRGHKLCPRWRSSNRFKCHSRNPGICGLKHKLNSCKSTYCKPLINELRSAINKRLLKYESQRVHALYITGAVVDQCFKLQWCQQDEFEPIKCTVVSEIHKYSATCAATTESQASTSSVQPHESPEPPAKKAKLFSFIDSLLK